MAADASGKTVADTGAQQGQSRRQSALRTFYDATRSLGSPAAILAVMSRLLREQLGIAFFLYFEATGGNPRLAILDPDDETPFDPSDRERLNQAFEALANRPHWTATRVIEDERDTPKRPDDPIAIIAALMNVRAGINVPIMKEGSRVAAMTVLDVMARRWTADDVELCEELAEALWATIARARAESATAEREAQFRTLAQNIPALCWLGDPQGRAYWANAKWEEYFGPLAINGGDMGAPVHPEDRARTAAAWRVARQRREAIEIGVRLRGRDGGYRPFQASSAPIHEAGGGLAGWCGTLVDLSEREAHSRRQAFLRAFYDATRELTSAASVLTTLGEMMTAHMGIGQVTYIERGEHDPPGFDIFVARPDAPLRKLAEPFRFEEGFEPLLDCYRSGRTLVVYDYDDEVPELTRPVVAARRAIGTCASITVPLVKDGHLVAMLSAVEPEPRRWTRDEVGLVEELAERVWTVVSRTRAEAALQERERNQALLIEWTDRLRGETDPDAILSVTLEMLGTHLCVTRATYSLGDATGETFAIAGEWRRDGATSILGTTYTMDQAGADLRRDWEAGRVLRYDDVAADPRIEPGKKPGYADARIAAFVSVPLLEHGRVRAALSVQHDESRTWCEPEVQLLCDIAARTWAVLERARTESELKERERHQAFLIHWTDSLRDVADASAIIATTLEMLGDYFTGITRATFSEGDETGRLLVNRGEWLNGVKSIAEVVFDVGETGSAIAATWLRGAPVIYDDIVTDVRIPDARRAFFAGTEVRSLVTVPLVEAGRIRAALSLQSKAQRSWQPAEVALVRDVTERVWVAVERARVQARLEGRERGQAFLVAWNDLIGGQGDARAVLAQTVTMLGEHLGAARVNYAEPNDAFTTMTVVEEWCAGTVPSVAGVTYRLDDFGERLADAQRSGRPVRIEDIATDPLLDERTRPLFEAIGVRAALTLPMLRGGEIVAVLSVQDRRPRRWTDAEVDLVRDLADRTLAVLERVQSEARLAEREAQLSAFMDHAPVAMNLRDEDGRYIRVNPEFARAVGLQMDDILGLTPSEIFPSRVARQVEAVDRRALSGEVASIELSDGVDRDYGSVLTIAFPIGDGSGAAKTAGFTIDLTERRRAEAALAKSRETLYQAEKLSALGSLLAGVSHELNNPLSIVVAQAVMMERQSQGTELGERAQKIRKAADRCGRIVQSFLAMARQKQPEREPVDLNAVATAALELAEFGLKNDGISSLRALTPGLPPILADSDQLHQIVINLIVNAQQSMVEGGGAERTLTLRSALGEKPGTVLLDVADTGPGIPPDVRRRIFEPFYTTKPQGQGTGVGLSFSQGLAEAHGGTLEVIAAPQGACFRLTLPIDPSGSLDAPAVAAPAAAPPTSRRALVIDDEREIAESLADFLSLDGFDCELAVGGAAAKQALAAGDYDLIISDLRMPGVDGPHLHAWMVAERPDLVDRVAFATGDTLSRTAARFLGELDRPVLEKPFTPEAVRRLLEQMELA